MSLPIRGTRHTGQDIRRENMVACLAVSNIVRTSLGPLGLDKMLVDDIGDVTITNDGATILKKLDVEHPCAKVLVELANLQDKEVGDGTTSVVIIAAELLRRANNLVEENIHPTSIISGFQKAKKYAVQFIAQNMALKTKELGEQCLINCAKTSMSSKIIGKDSQFFAEMVVKAMLSVETLNSAKKKRYPVKAVEIVKITGKGLRASQLINGYCLHEYRCSQQMPRRIVNARIAMIDFDLRKMALKFGVQMVIEDTAQIEAMRLREADAIKEKVELLIEAGANVILTSKGIDDMCIKYFVSRGCIAVRRVDRKKLKRIAKLTGGKLLISLADEDASQSVPAAALGDAALVEEQRLGDREILFIKGCKSTKAQTIVLRGVNWYMLEELERSVHDALCVIKRVLESGRVVPGGGAVEAALSIHLESIAEQVSSREQLAIAEFAQAMLVIPRTLAINGGYDAAELVSVMRAHHAASQMNNQNIQKQRQQATDANETSVTDAKNTAVDASAAGAAAAAADANANANASESASTNATEDESKADRNSNEVSASAPVNVLTEEEINNNRKRKNYGIDLDTGEIHDRVRAGVLEPAMSKIKSIKYATEAAITILRIDDAITLARAENPRGPNP